MGWMSSQEAHHQVPVLSYLHYSPIYSPQSSHQWPSNWPLWPWPVLDLDYRPWPLTLETRLTLFTKAQSEASLIQSPLSERPHPMASDPSTNPPGRGLPPTPRLPWEKVPSTSEVPVERFRRLLKLKGMGEGGGGGLIWNNGIKKCHFPCLDSSMVMVGGGGLIVISLWLECPCRNFKTNALCQ